MEIELKPCPFCGCECHIIIGFSGIAGIVCDRCGAFVSFMGSEKQKEAVKAWNRREEGAANDYE